jgi:hypothetical protein
MMAEETQAEETQAEETSLIDEAKSIRDDAMKAVSELKAEREKIEKIRVNDMLGGRSGAGNQPMTPEEEKADKAKAMSDEIVGAFR